MELDVHGSDGIAYLCHQTDCSAPWHRFNLRRVLAEIKSFLDSRPDQLVLIRLEDHMNGSEYDWFNSSLIKTYGHQIYTPPKQNAGFKTCLNGGTRPVESLVSSQLIKEGQQIIFIGLDCNRDGAVRAEDMAFIYPQKEIWFDRDIVDRCDGIASDKHYFRAVEGDNTFSNKQFNPVTLSTAARCGVNDLAMDHIGAGDSEGMNSDSPKDWSGRYGLQFWTFKTNGIQWLDHQQVCVASVPDGNEGSGLNSLASYETSACDQPRAYLCHNGIDYYLARNGEDIIKRGWENGRDMRLQYGGGEFSSPRTPMEVYSMMNLIHEENAGHAWLNLKQKPEGFRFFSAARTSVKTVPPK